MLICLSCLTGCGVFQTLPSFDYNGKSKNHWIVNRIPDYGDGHRDGCVVLGELEVSLQEKSPGEFTGWVEDIEEKELPVYATLIVNEGLAHERELHTDQYGKFSFRYDQPIETISFLGNYQRKLTINMR